MPADTRIASQDDPAPIAIFGGKGGGEVSAQHLVAAGAQDRILGFLNDQHPVGTKIAGFDVLGGFDDWKSLPGNTRFVAPLHKVKEAQARSQLVEALDIPEERWTSICHPFASIASSATLGPGATIGAFVDVQPSVTLGRHVAIRSSAYIAHDVQLEDFVFIGAGTAIAGYCQVGHGAFVGINSAIHENTKIGAFAVVGMGSGVTRDVADYEIVAGTPARHIGFVPRLGEAT